MANLNKKPGQGKTPQQYKDSSRLAWYGVVGMIILLFLMSLLTGCTGVYYLTDAEYSDAREDHASLTYHNNSIYWGWNSGYYYYYGKPHYYPWTYYYNICPPSHHNQTTHIIVNRPVNRPTHRPNRPTYKPNNTIRTNINRNKINVKSNKSKNSNRTRVKTHRKPR